VETPDYLSGVPVATAASTAIRPLFLLADSQLLFHKEEGGLFLARVIQELGRPPESIRAAYLGAANGDVAEYYDIFVAAMEGIGVVNCRMIRAKPSDVDRAFLEEASIVLLAGGDPARGQETLRDNGLADRIIARYAAGAVLIGVSAGAMQLGMRARGGPGQKAVDGFRLAPLVVGVHDEPDWADLTALVKATEGGRGIGIPSGGGAVVHGDLTLEPVRRVLTEITVTEEGALQRALLMPGQVEKPAGDAEA
jgi:hypothetical protein